MNQVICKAIQNKSVLKFTYQGHQRVVEPHAYGLSRARNEVIRCYQIGGTSSSEIPAWKLFEVDEIESLKVTNEHFLKPHDGYSKGDKHMIEIYCEL